MPRTRMIRRRTTRVCGIALVVLLGLSMRDLLAQTPSGRNRPAPGRGPLADGAAVTPREVQRLFDAYVVMQAQQQLELTDEQYPRFLTRLRALQDARRRGEGERAALLGRLRQLLRTTGSSEDQIQAQLSGLAELEARIAAETRQALNGVDEVLQVRQRARFRVFEEQIERRKLELLMRARQANRPRSQF